MAAYHTQWPTTAAGSRTILGAATTRPPCRGTPEIPQPPCNRCIEALPGRQPSKRHCVPGTAVPAFPPLRRLAEHSPPRSLLPSCATPHPPSRGHRPGVLQRARSLLPSRPSGYGREGTSRQPGSPIARAQAQPPPPGDREADTPDGRRGRSRGPPPNVSGQAQILEPQTTTRTASRRCRCSSDAPATAASRGRRPGVLAPASRTTPSQSGRPSACAPTEGEEPLPPLVAGPAAAARAGGSGGEGGGRWRGCGSAAGSPPVSPGCDTGGSCRGPPPSS